ncbi:hypothetical protein KIPB_008702, partial [Kipferlia bialata]
PFFGDALAVSGDWAAITAGEEVRSQTDGTHVGAVFMYHDVDEVWQYQSRLPAPTDSTNVKEIGGEIAIDGAWCAVGASTTDQWGNYEGSVIGLYNLKGDEWSLLRSIENAEGTGYSLAMGGGVLVIGYRDAQDNQGEANVYRLSGSEYVHETTLTAQTTQTEFGSTCTVSADGTRVLIGAEGGLVSVYDHNNGQWYLTQTIAADCDSMMRLSVGAHGLPIAVGDPSGDRHYAGHVEIYDICDRHYAGHVEIYDHVPSAGSIELVQTLHGTKAYQYFGYATAFTSDVSAHTMAVGTSLGNELLIYQRADDGQYCVVDTETSPAGVYIGSNVAFARKDNLLLSGAPDWLNGIGLVGEFDLTLLP